MIRNSSKKVDGSKRHRIYGSLLCGVTRVWTYNRSRASIHDIGAMNNSKNAGDLCAPTKYALSAEAGSAKKCWYRSMTFPSDRSEPLLMSKIVCPSFQCIRNNPDDSFAEPDGTVRCHD